METIVAHHEKLYKAYYELPKRQRTRECDKVVEEFKAMVETITKKNGNGLRVHINTIISETDGHLHGIFEGYETLCSSIEFAKVKKDSESSGIETGESDNEASTSAAGGEPAPTSGQDDCEAWQDVQDQNDEVASLRKSMATTIRQLRGPLREKDVTLRKHAGELEYLKSHLYVGEIVARLNDYVVRGGRGLEGVKQLTESIARDPATDKVVKSMIESAQQQFNDAKRFSPLRAFQVVAKGVKNGRSAVAHPEKVDVQTLIKACSGRATEQKLLNVLLAVAEDKTYPLRKVIHDEY